MAEAFSNHFAPKASWIKPQTPADDQLHDFACPCEDGQAPNISIDLADSVFLHVSIAAMKLNGLVGDSIYHLTEPILGHGHFLDDILTGDVILQEVIQEWATQLNLSG